MIHSIIFRETLSIIAAQGRHCVSGVLIDFGRYSVLGPLQARELTDLGTEPYQEFLTLILKPRIAFV